jgi:hypothetical protein
MQAVFMAGGASTAAVQKILCRQGWSEPRPRLLICRSIIHKMIQAPWIKRAVVPTRYEFFPWQELRSTERQWLENHCGQAGWYPDVLSPFLDEDRMESANSVGLRYQGTVSGWMITHRVSANTIRYTTLFVRRELQQLGRGIALVAESLRRHYAWRRAEAPYGIWNFELSNRSMGRFFERHLMPYSTSSDVTLGSHKILGTAPARQEIAAPDSRQTGSGMTAGVRTDL